MNKVVDVKLLTKMSKELVNKAKLKKMQDKEKLGEIRDSFEELKKTASGENMAKVKECVVKDIDKQLEEV